MSQTKLEKFLEFKCECKGVECEGFACKGPEGYDFKCEMPKYYKQYEGNWKHSIKYQGILKILKEEEETFSMRGDSARRYQLYKILGNCGANFDCDNSNGTCDLTGEIYWKLWGAKKQGKWGAFSVPGFSELWGGDTMNSFDIIYGDIVKSNPELKNTLEKEYSSIYTTLGNFVLVPRGFNGERSKETKDYWVKSLDILRQNGYENDKTTASFTPEKDFKKYINTFFLWDYTTVTGSQYEVKKLPDIKDETFLNGTIDCIKRRSIFMVALLRIGQKNQDDLDAIMEYLSPTDPKLNKLFRDIEDAVDKICDANKAGFKLDNDSVKLLKNLFGNNKE